MRGQRCLLDENEMGKDWYGEWFKCLGCGFQWSEGKDGGMDAYQADPRSNLWKRVPKGTLPVFKEQEDPDRLCPMCGGHGSPLAFDENFAKCGKCGFEWCPEKHGLPMEYWNKGGILGPVPKGCLMTGEGEEE